MLSVRYPKGKKTLPFTELVRVDFRYVCRYLATDQMKPVTDNDHEIKSLAIFFRHANELGIQIDGLVKLVDESYATRPARTQESLHDSDDSEAEESDSDSEVAPVLSARYCVPGDVFDELADEAAARTIMHLDPSLKKKQEEILAELKVHTDTAIARAKLEIATETRIQLRIEMAAEIRSIVAENLKNAKDEIRLEVEAARGPLIDFELDEDGLTDIITGSAGTDAL